MIKGSSMYEEITRNIRKSYFLIFLMVALVVLIGFIFGEYTGSRWAVPIAVGFAAFSSLTSYYYSDRIVLSISRARPARKTEHAHLINSVEGLAIAAGLPVPRVFVIEDAALNAFATGRDPRHSAICVTTGLLGKLNRVELEGVIGHEMSHIKNYDIRLSTMVAVLVGIAVLLSDWMLRSMRWGGGRRRGRSDGGGAIIAIVGLLLAVLAPFAGMAIQAAVSRQREYLADANGSLLTRYPPGLASALEKIAADTQPLASANKATAHLYIANPLRMFGGISNLFNTHPPIQDRIKRLREM
jgi:heat shock protein HtpX